MKRCGASFAPRYGATTAPLNCLAASSSTRSASSSTCPRPTTCASSCSCASIASSKSETQIFACPDIDWSRAIVSLKDQVALRRQLRAQAHFLAHDEDCSRRLIEALTNVFAGIIAYLPRFADGAPVACVPLYSLLDAHDLVDRMIGTLSKTELLDRGLLAGFNDQIYRNICAVSKVVPYEPLKRPLVPAADCDAAGRRSDRGLSAGHAFSRAVSCRCSLRHSRQGVPRACRHLRPVRSRQDAAVAALDLSVPRPGGSARLVRPR